MSLVWMSEKTNKPQKKKNPNKPHFGYIPFTGGDHEVICAFGSKFNDSGKLLFLEAALKLSMSSLFIACQSRNDDVPGWALSSTPDVGGHHATKSLATVWGWILPCTVGVRGEDHGPHVCSPYLYKSVFPVRLVKASTFNVFLCLSSHRCLVCFDPVLEKELDNPEMKLIWEECEHEGGWHGSHWQQTKDHGQHVFQEPYTWCERSILLHMFFFLGSNGAAT